MTDLSSANGQAEHYRSVRDRLLGPITPKAVIKPTLQVDADQVRERDMMRLADKESEAPSAELWDVILREVCLKHKVSRQQLYRDLRSPSLVIARHEAMYRMSAEALMNTEAIGRRMGGRDRKSVVYGIGRHAQRMAAQ